MDSSPPRHSGYKRPHDSSPSESEPHGGKKPEVSSARLAKLAEDLLRHFSVLRREIAEMPAGDNQKMMVDTLNELHNSLGLIQWQSSPPSHPSLYDAINFDTRFPQASPESDSSRPDNRDGWPNVSQINEELQRIHDTWVEENPSVTTDSAPRLSPHNFALPSRWVPYQQRNVHLRCLRPSNQAILLPLSTCHNVFRRYSIRADPRNVLPTPLSGHDTYAAAGLLVKQMGDHFAKEKDRGAAFASILNSVIPDLTWRKEAYVAALGTEAFTDAVFYGFKKTSRESRLPIILREDKNEPGHNGDAYMQLCRTYQMWATQLEGRAAGDPLANARFEAGCPMFLLSLVGPILSVYGGLYVKGDYLIEPLSPPTSILKDGKGSVARQRALSQALDALLCGVQEIEDPPNGDKPNLNSIQCGVPSIYDTCRIYPPGSAEDALDTPLMLISQNVSSIDESRPVFEAEWTNPVSKKTEKVVVKMTEQKYGVEAHRLFASKGYAPKLLATSERNGAPTCYVIERLNPDHWVSLDKLHAQQPNIKDSSKDLIRTALTNILTALAAEEVVHGNFRPSNVMVKVRGGCIDCDEGGHGVLNLISWDWSGKVGEVPDPHGRRSRWDDPLWRIGQGIIDTDTGSLLLQAWFNW